MVRLHNPYEDPAVRLRHRRMVTRATIRWFNTSFLVVFSIGAFVSLIALVSPFDGGGLSFRAGFVTLVGAAFVSAIVAAPLALWARFITATNVRRSGAAFGRDYCKLCGYPLEGLRDPVCPECGRRV